MSEQILQGISKIYVYGGLPANTDTNNQEALARQDRVRGLIGRVTAALSFAEPEMIAIGFETLKSWLAADASSTVLNWMMGSMSVKLPISP